MDPMSPEIHGWSILQKLNEQKSMGLFCDVSLMVEGKIFLAHKNVLSACSEYFYAALSRNEQQQFLVLDNVRLEGFSHLLDFIYSYKIPTCHVQDFMQAAQVLQVSLPLTVQVVNVSSSPQTSTAKEDISISEENFDVRNRGSESREFESQQLRRGRDESTPSVNAVMYSEEIRRFDTVAQMKEKAKIFTRPAFYKDNYVTRNPNFFVHKSVAISGRMANSMDEPRETSFPNTSFARQLPITIHNDGSSEEADDENGDMCINLCDEPDTPDSLEPPLTLNDLSRHGESMSPKVYSTIVGIEGSEVIERIDGDADVVHKCDSCQLSLHMSSHHNKKFYQCDQCGKELSTLKKLHDHIAYHSDARPHKCRLCDKAYKVKNDLTQHIRVKHLEASNGKAPLLQLCEFCGQAVKHYKSHKIFCSGIKKFKCDFCVQSFHRISELKRHTWTHTGELPYRCKICGKGCRHPSNMKKHIRTVHKADMRVQINREHASPRFCKNRRPPTKLPGQILQQTLPTDLSVMQTAATIVPNQVNQMDSSLPPVSVGYISISTMPENTGNDFSLFSTQNFSAEPTRPL
ncbi:zinc finger and BTB domain-containing protein 49 isoform X2 [Xenopus laevis]|uniref:Zinc finger and BTB domain-containing protein 49 isoform X2 n=1 Tax=Xenopus laevis TaxID=8355 RepID=A0A8J1KPD4_XENLA|nr:zinc finger and BTB domain-containing protein 49 isoform X2 [Xenopus laevis]